MDDKTKFYKLKIDLPGEKAGKVYRYDPVLGLIDPEWSERSGMGYSRRTLENHPDILKRFFEPAFDQPEEKSWEPVETLKLPAIGLEVALEDYTEGATVSFSWHEAIEIEDKLDNGWRLPTAREWWLICLAVTDPDEEDYVDARSVAATLEMNRLYYWSSSVYSDISSRYLAFYTDGTNRNLDPQGRSSKGSAFAVRLVKDLEEDDD